VIFCVTKNVTIFVTFFHCLPVFELMEYILIRISELFSSALLGSLRGQK